MQGVSLGKNKNPCSALLSPPALVVDSAGARLYSLTGTMSSFASQIVHVGNFPGNIHDKFRRSPLQGSMGSSASRTLYVGNLRGDIRERIGRSPLHGTLGSSASRTLYVGNLPGDIRERIRRSPLHGRERLAAFDLEGDLTDSGLEAKNESKVHGKKFDFCEDDLLSDDSIWALYDRWMSHHKVSRDLNEKKKRFNVFKWNANYVLKSNKEDKCDMLGLNLFGDRSYHELVMDLFPGMTRNEHLPGHDQPRVE